MSPSKRKTKRTTRRTSKNKTKGFLSKRCPYCGDREINCMLINWEGLNQKHRDEYIEYIVNRIDNKSFELFPDIKISSLRRTLKRKSRK